MGNPVLRVGAARLDPLGPRSIASRMRYEDIREAADLANLSPQEAIQTSLKASEGNGRAYVVYADETPEVVFGCVGSSAIGVGHPWLLGTDIIAALPVSFAKLFVRYVKEFQGLFPILTNIMDARNESHLKWLEATGFKFIKDYPDFGPGRVLAKQFIKVA